MDDFFNSQRFQTFFSITCGALIFFLIASGIAALSESNFRKRSVFPTNVITARGTAKINAVPDVASFYITVREEDSDVAKAQQKMAEKAKKAVEFLLQNGVEEKDIRTQSYNTGPKYTYPTPICKNSICTPINPVISGYEVSESFEVKVRDTKKAGEILSGVAALLVGETSGLNFVIEDTDKFKAEARAQAIKKAKEDAKLTAKSLGVKLGDIVRFSEDNSYFEPRGMMMAKAMDSALVAAPIEAGEQKVSATVSITYEIR